MSLFEVFIAIKVLVIMSAVVWWTNKRSTATLFEVVVYSRFFNIMKWHGKLRQNNSKSETGDKTFVLMYSGSFLCILRGLHKAFIMMF